jgi:ABC-2 type transport system permease protein
VFGGYLMPLSVMPDTLRTIANWLPFRSMLSLPIEIASGVLPASEWPAALGIQAGWVAVVFVLATWVWKRGLARYGAFGA